VSRKRDYERARRHRMVKERGAAKPTPTAKHPGGKWETLAENRGWTRPPVVDWREERRLPRGSP